METYFSLKIYAIYWLSLQTQNKCKQCNVLIRGAGRDATNLFNEVHQWVNYESMLSACVVGKLVSTAEFLPPPTAKSTTSIPQKAGN